MWYHLASSCFPNWYDHSMMSFIFIVNLNPLSRKSATMHATDGPRNHFVQMLMSWSFGHFQNACVVILHRKCPNDSLIDQTVLANLVYRVKLVFNLSKPLIRPWFGDSQFLACYNWAPWIQNSVDPQTWHRSPSHAECEVTPHVYLHWHAQRECMTYPGMTESVDPSNCWSRILFRILQSVCPSVKLLFMPLTKRHKILKGNLFLWRRIIGCRVFFSSGESGLLQCGFHSSDLFNFKDKLFVWGAGLR